MASPQERDLAIGRHAVMAEAFELLANYLGPFIDARMAEYFRDEQSWAEAAANRLGRPAEHGATDPLFQLLVLRRFWGPVFADFYGEDLRQIIGQLIDTRNMWAHFSFPDDPSALQRSVLAIERLLAPVEPEVAGRLRHLRSQVTDPNAQVMVVAPPGADTDGPTESPTDPSADRSASPDDAEGRAEADAELQGQDRRSGERRKSEQPDVNALLAQLSETESVFRDLQSQYGDLQAELNQSRRITATKQLRLSKMEQRLLEVEDHSMSVLEDLMEERITRQHIEWLIVGLLATILLFMLLAST